MNIHQRQLPRKSLPHTIAVGGLERGRLRMLALPASTTALTNWRAGVAVCCLEPNLRLGVRSLDADDPGLVQKRMERVMPLYQLEILPSIGVIFMILVALYLFGPGGPLHSGRSREGAGNNGPRWEEGRGSGTESALDILMRRYAAGEITREQYEQMRRDLTA